MRVDFAGAIFPEKRESLAGVEMEADAVQGAGAAELFRHRMHGQQCVGRYLGSSAAAMDGTVTAAPCDHARFSPRRSSRCPAEDAADLCSA